MSVHLLKALEQISDQVAALGATTGRQLLQANRALRSRDMLLAKRVIKQNQRLSAVRQSVEEDCLHTLALYQPVALDLRFIVAVVKMSKDLEAISACAVEISEISLRLAQRPERKDAIDTCSMADEVRAILTDVISALVTRDAHLVSELPQREAGINNRHREHQRRLEDAIVQEPERTRELLQLLSVSRCLKRAATHASSMFSDVLYAVEGRRISDDQESQLKR